jgi:hypothetical protein
MALRILIIDDEFKRKASEVLAYACLSENLYRPGLDAKIPGDDPKHVVVTGDYKIVFSLTYIRSEDTVYRHFSMSVANRSRLPHPVAIEEVLSFFGFFGGLKMCMVDVNEREGCVVVVQDARLQVPAETSLES